MSFPLNAPQREAVRHCAGPLLVLAGAGSGKTRVITAKIAHLIEQGVDPARIVAITFTNKAAREMRERAQALLKAQGKGDLAGKVTIATFHALGLKILRMEAKAMGLKPGFSIFDPADLEGIVAELVATADRGRARAAQWRISAWKNALVAPAAALASAQNDDELAAARAYANYDETLAAYQAVDFDDLIVRPLALLESDTDAAARWRQRCAHVLVDEYQDTNPAQYRLLRALVACDDAVHVRRRRRPGDLRLARRDDRQPGSAAARIIRISRSSSSSRTTGRPCASCARRMRSSATIRSSSRSDCGASTVRATRSA